MRLWPPHIQRLFFVCVFLLISFCQKVLSSTNSTFKRDPTKVIIDAEWTIWSSWSECENGLQIRVRGCYKTVGFDCIGKRVESTPCDFGLDILDQQSRDNLNNRVEEKQTGSRDNNSSSTRTQPIDEKSDKAEFANKQNSSSSSLPRSDLPNPVDFQKNALIPLQSPLNSSVGFLPNSPTNSKTIDRLNVSFNIDSKLLNRTIPRPTDRELSTNQRTTSNSNKFDSKNQHLNQSALISSKLLSNGNAQSNSPGIEIAFSTDSNNAYSNNAGYSTYTSGSGNRYYNSGTSSRNSYYKPLYNRKNNNNGYSKYYNSNDYKVENWVAPQSTFTEYSGRSYYNNKKGYGYLNGYNSDSTNSKIISLGSPGEVQKYLAQLGLLGKVEYVDFNYGDQLPNGIDFSLVSPIQSSNVLLLPPSVRPQSPSFLGSAGEMIRSSPGTAANPLPPSIRPSMPSGATASNSGIWNLVYGPNFGSPPSFSPLPPSSLSGSPPSGGGNNPPSLRPQAPSQSNSPVDIRPPAIRPNSPAAPAYQSITNDNSCGQDANCLLGILGSARPPAVRPNSPAVSLQQYDVYRGSHGEVVWSSKPGVWSGWSSWSWCNCQSRSRTRSCIYDQSLYSSGCYGQSYQKESCAGSICTNRHRSSPTSSSYADFVGVDQQQSYKFVSRDDSRDDRSAVFALPPSIRPQPPGSSDDGYGGYYGNQQLRMPRPPNFVLVVDGPNPWLTLGAPSSSSYGGRYGYSNDGRSRMGMTSQANRMASSLLGSSSSSSSTGSTGSTTANATSTGDNSTDPGAPSSTPRAPGMPGIVPNAPSPSAGRNGYYGNYYANGPKQFKIYVNPNSQHKAYAVNVEQNYYSRPSPSYNYNNNRGYNKQSYGNRGKSNSRSYNSNKRSYYSSRPQYAFSVDDNGDSALLNVSNFDVYLCPDGSIPLGGSTFPISCGTGDDNNLLCPVGYFCHAHLDQQLTLCCLNSTTSGAATSAATRSHSSDTIKVEKTISIANLTASTTDQPQLATTTDDAVEGAQQPMENSRAAAEAEDD